MRKEADFCDRYDKVTDDVRRVDIVLIVDGMDERKWERMLSAKARKLLIGRIEDAISPVKRPPVKAKPDEG